MDRGVVTYLLSRGKGNLSHKVHAWFSLKAHEAFHILTLKVSNVKSVKGKVENYV